MKLRLHVLVPPLKLNKKLTRTGEGFYLPGTRFFAREAPGLSGMGAGSNLHRRQPPRLLLSAAVCAIAPAEIAARRLGLYGAVCAAALFRGRRPWHGQRFQNQNDTQPTNRCTTLIHRLARASKFFTLTARSRLRYRLRGVVLVDLPARLSAG
jgi:hypothetical protein